MRHLKIVYLLSLGSILFLLPGCVQDKLDFSGDTIGADESWVTLQMNIASSRIPTKATDPNTTWNSGSESFIDNIDVLVYDELSGNFAYYTYGTDIETGTGKVKVKVRLTPEGQKHKLVLLANMHEEIMQLKAAGELDTDENNPVTITEVLNKVQFEVYKNEQDETERVWNITYPNPKYLPMWGETPEGYVFNTTNEVEKLKKVEMLRAVARIDLKMELGTEYQNKFIIDTVWVYNVANQSLAAPDPSNLLNKPESENNISANFPTVLPDSKVNFKRIQYLSESSSETKIFQTIYVGEAENIGIDHQKRLCLLIAGRYDKDGNTSTQKATYYRVDFYDSDGKILDVLRNYTYTFTITAVDGPGEETPETALRTKAINMHTTVLDWDKWELDEVFYDGISYYSVSPREFDLLSVETQNSEYLVEILTNSIHNDIQCEIEEDKDNMFAIEPYIKEEKVVTDEETRAQLAFKVDKWDMDIEGKTREAIVNIYFYSEDGTARVKIPVRIKQSSSRPEFWVDENEKEYLYISHNNTSFNNEAYIFLNGYFEVAPVRVAVRGVLGDEHRPTLGGVLYGQSDYHDAGLNDTAYVKYSSSAHISLPYYGLHGFVPEAYRRSLAQNIPLWTPLTYNYTFQYKVKESDATWVNMLRADTHDTNYLKLTNSTSTDIPASGGSWEIEVEGIWQTPILWIVKDGNGEEIERAILPSGIYTLTNPH